MSQALQRISKSSNRVINHFKQELDFYKQILSKDENYNTIKKEYSTLPVKFTGSLSSLSLKELDYFASLGVKDFTSYLKLHTNNIDLGIKSGDRIGIKNHFYLVETVKEYTRIGITYLEIIIIEEA
ncbi:DUF1506 domain-containing protein (plasmid) [Borrelia sp. A-FGy1]|uniref:DUF1506 family protein n=1 Tax=Borrelia sp. A-FGy1 TaxID=2608247 RepID=UPI0015F5656C|nr:DUF1506 family protein [Borrelia sp. A-FGy1]QMU99833.1 DUF1506 domain-containing protein [Borrelia sp. A-FGy1]